MNIVSGSAYNFATTGFRNSLKALMEFPFLAKQAAAEARDKGVLLDALMAGDSIGAKEAMQRYIRQGENHEQREILKRSLKQSIKSRQPLRVGTAGEARREAFLDWTQCRLSSEDLQRARQIDAIYRKTAERMGLM